MLLLQKNTVCCIWKCLCLAAFFSLPCEPSTQCTNVESKKRASNRNRKEQSEFKRRRKWARMQFCCLTIVVVVSVAHHMRRIGVQNYSVEIVILYAIETFSDCQTKSVDLSLSCENSYCLPMKE